MTLPGAVAINMLDMIGAGPFITLPLLLGAMGGPQAMLGWICGAALAVCDGLVWAELGAAMPEEGWNVPVPADDLSGRHRAFSFLLILLSGDLFRASERGERVSWAGAVCGVSRARFERAYTASCRFIAGPGTLVAIAAVGLAMVFALPAAGPACGVVSYVLWVAVIVTFGWIFVTAAVYGHVGQAFAFRLERSG